MVLAFWLVLPVVAFVAIPIYRGLALVSLYEYLEQRFDARVRLAASLIFVAWRMAWIVGGDLSAVRGDSHGGWLECAGVAGGDSDRRAGHRGGVSGWNAQLRLERRLKGLAMFGGAAAVMFAVWMNLTDGPPRMAEITRGLSAAWSLSSYASPGPIPGRSGARCRSGC